MLLHMKTDVVVDRLYELPIYEKNLDFWLLLGLCKRNL